MIAPVILTMVSVLIATTPQPSETRWTMDENGRISWTVSGKPHQDHMEMSGRKVSVIVGYGTDEAGDLRIDRHIVWPGLRTIPNNTYGSLSDDFSTSVFPEITVDGRRLSAEKPRKFTIRGMLSVESATDTSIVIRRTILPSTRNAAVVENCVAVNTSDREHEVRIAPLDEVRRTNPAKGVDGEYIVEAKGFGDGDVRLGPGESVEFGIVFSARHAKSKPIEVDPSMEQKARESYVDDLWSNLQFECPDPVLTREFAFCKVRAAESIFETRGGLLHGPGGRSYYAAIWANDQAEYANPFFPFLGDYGGNESAANAYRHFARFMNPEYKPIPSSIIAEGTDIWNGAGDRGDAAMIAYGASRFALARGDRKIAEELWPLVEWCLEYCRRRTNAQGVVASDCDELERRFPAGDANLCTSSLTYDALHSAAFLARDLGKPESVAAEYEKRADELRASMEKHFGATVDGFKTYRYYDGNTTLRAWICIPLVMGIFDRKDATIDALFSPKLWTKDGLASEAGSTTFWDRSTLYALRGVFAAGDTDRALNFLTYYSNRRLLGDHVPYPVEAWPEGNQQHLSAESALYCRIITEGLFDIRPTGLREFRITPHLPKGWKRMALRNVHGFGNVYDVEVTDGKGDSKLKVSCERGEAVVSSTGDGETYVVKLPE